MGIAGLRVDLKDAAEALRKSSEGTTDPERLAVLEGRIEAVDGRVEGGLIEMGALKAAARAAEDRGRHHLKRAEKTLALATELEGSEEVDSFEAAGRAYGLQPPPGDDAEVDEVPPLPSRVANHVGGRETAKAAKRR